MSGFTAVLHQGRTTQRASPPPLNGQDGNRATVVAVVPTAAADHCGGMNHVFELTCRALEAGSTASGAVKEIVCGLVR
ncbi:MAG TPA: hypothetical protein VNX21_01750 [Candidatus Thermoplasmatota archaeon]|nr:hypothetical protein [Candidatus Thermoplasmatota archaeon]